MGGSTRKLEAVDGLSRAEQGATAPIKAVASPTVSSLAKARMKKAKHGSELVPAVRRTKESETESNRTEGPSNVALLSCWYLR